MSKAHQHTHNEPGAAAKAAEPIKEVDTCSSIATKLEQLTRDIHTGISEQNRDRVCGELETLAKRLHAIG